jgi:hypothetical protein
MKMKLKILSLTLLKCIVYLLTSAICLAICMVGFLPVLWIGEKNFMKFVLFVNRGVE